ncbi:hypothetical protein HPB48_007999 [Haemaphysalis longicornis]|uniref:Uncharacterized protein n=1 Tax=Haemaphysalis longicornis TaxID=44386 RepID=A0A9J6GLL6_HAELO|nr:hypothetical protein HPB48_007999 [Haemaphysalis longicornis]
MASGSLMSKDITTEGSGCSPDGDVAFPESRQQAELVQTGFPWPTYLASQEIGIAANEPNFPGDLRAAVIGNATMATVMQIPVEGEDISPDEFGSSCGWTTSINKHNSASKDARKQGDRTSSALRNGNKDLLWRNARSIAGTPISATPAVGSAIEPMYVRNPNILSGGWCGESDPDNKHDCYPKRTLGGDFTMAANKTCKQRYQMLFVVSQPQGETQARRRWQQHLQRTYVT